MHSEDIQGTMYVHNQLFLIGLANGTSRVGVLVDWFKTQNVPCVPSCLGPILVSNGTGNRGVDPKYRVAHLSKSSEKFAGESKSAHRFGAKGPATEDGMKTKDNGRKWMWRVLVAVVGLQPYFVRGQLAGVAFFSVSFAAVAFVSFRFDILQKSSVVSGGGGAGQAQEKSKAPKRIAIRAGRLIDGKSDAPLANALIVIEGEEIVSVSAGGAAPGGVEVIDLSNATVLPGLVDTHTHVLLNGDITSEDYDAQLLKESIPYRAILSARNARIALEHGFTTMRDLETEGAMYADVDIKKAIANGEVPGPRMQVATRAMTPTGMYPLIGYSWDMHVP